MTRSRASSARRRESLAPGAAALVGAARAVAGIAFRGRSAEQALEDALTQPSPARRERVAEPGEGLERSAVRAVALGTVRWYWRLAPAMTSLVQRRPESLPPEVRALLIVAAHQIEYSRNAPELTVNAAVDATRALDQARASGFVNAVLRRFVAEREAVMGSVDADRAARTAHPRWMVDAIDREWAHHADRILAANNAHPPMVLRVDLSRSSVAECVRELATAGLGARPIEWAPSAVLLDRPVPVATIPGFAEGRVSVQDAGAQLAAPLLDARPQMRVLDACAAPGGKTGHLLEHTRGIELTAVDVDAGRLARVRENLQRLRREARLASADVRDTDAFWDGRPFDRILLDAPCSSTGVIRRHPDIKLLRRPSDIASFAAAQLEMLHAAFAMLAPGGRLIYATCSILGAENEGVTRQFLNGEPHARSGPLPPAGSLAPGAIQGQTGIQLLPGAQAGTDGFHYACIEKATTGT
ncbi:MAG: 16S rRNA (cytosine(967)-C(5))-methyltransferase RsmB [Steroidobacteraceae bacterium]